LPGALWRLGLALGRSQRAADASTAFARPLSRANAASVSSIRNFPSTGSSCGGTTRTKDRWPIGAGSDRRASVAPTRRTVWLMIRDPGSRSTFGGLGIFGTPAHLADEMFAATSVRATHPSLKTRGVVMAPAESPCPIVGKLSAEPYRRSITGKPASAIVDSSGKAARSGSQARWCVLPKKAMGSRPQFNAPNPPLRRAPGGAVRQCVVLKCRFGRTHAADSWS
jgi:hypothetical protein